jgi:hypothetical protein
MYISFRSSEIDRRSNQTAAPWRAISRRFFGRAPKTRIDPLKASPTHSAATTVMLEFYRISLTC